MMRYIFIEYTHPFIIHPSAQTVRECGTGVSKGWEIPGIPVQPVNSIQTIMELLYE